jgi:hypothetical protein
MMLAHGSVAVIYALVGLLWIVNLAFLLPSIFVRRPYLAVLILALLATIFDAWLVWSFLRDTLAPGSEDRTFGFILVGLFGVLFLFGCFGIARLVRISK